MAFDLSFTFLPLPRAIKQIQFQQEREVTIGTEVEDCRRLQTVKDEETSAVAVNPSV